MAFSLYAATVPSYRQILDAVSGLLRKAQAFCTEKAIAPREIIQARLAEDMLPFAYQVIGPIAVFASASPISTPSAQPAC